MNSPSSPPPSLRQKSPEPADRARAALEREDHARQVANIVYTLRRHVWLVASVSLGVLACTTAYTLSQTKIYRATATLQFEPRPPLPLGHNVDTVVDMGSNSYWSDQEYYNTQFKILGSLRIATATVTELGLNYDGAFAANRATPNRLKEPLPAADAATLVQARLAVTPVKESRIAEVTYDDADPNRATRVLDAVVRAFMRNNLENTAQTTSAAVEWLTGQLQTLQKELASSELALHEYKVEKNISSIGLDEQTNILKTEIEQLAGARSQARARIQAARARLTQLKKIDPERPIDAPQTELFRSETLQDTRQAYISAEQTLKGLIGAGRGENHPEVKAASSRLASAKASLTSELKNIQTGAERELAALEQEEAGLSGLVATLEKKALDLNLMEIEYSRLARTKGNNEKLYSMVLERTKEASLSQMLKVNNVRIIDPPRTDGKPVRPRIPLALTFGTLVGLFLGVGAALARERLDRTIKSPSDIEERLDLIVLGHVPVTSKGYAKGRRRRGPEGAVDPGSPELAMHRDPKSGLAEAMRVIRTNLLFMSPDKPYKRLLLTSPSPSEGKTTMACCLGVAMAQAGQRVLLLDCDMRKPRLHRVFEQRMGQPTLSQSLISQTPIDLSLLATEVPNLSVLTAGPTPPNPAELLHSDAFRQLLRSLDKSFDLIILDTPPLIVTDAAVLSTLVDGSVLVVRSHATDRVQAARAKRAIGDAGGLIVGTILNAVDQSKSVNGYGYGSHYYARSAYGEGES